MEADGKLNAKEMLIRLAASKESESPFDRKIREGVRADLRIICKESGHGDGLPREGTWCRPLRFG